MFTMSYTGAFSTCTTSFQMETQNACNEIRNQAIPLNSEAACNETIWEIPIQQTEKNTLKSRKQKVPKKLSSKDRKILRNRGQAYVTVSGKLVQERSVKKLTSCRRKCSELITYDDQRIIFDKYYDQATYEKRFMFIKSHIEVAPRKQERINVKYYLPLANNKTEVCKKCFTDTLGETFGFVKTVIRKSFNELEETKKDLEKKLEELQKQTDEVKAKLEELQGPSKKTKPISQKSNESSSMNSSKKLTDRERQVLRNSGQAYITNSGKLVEKKIITRLTQCRRKCRERVPLQLQKKLFNHFYSLDSYKDKVLYLKSCLTVTAKKRDRSLSGKSKRVCTVLYDLIDGDRRINVCKQCFMNTLDLSIKFIRNIINKCWKSRDEIFVVDGRGKTSSVNKIPSEKIKELEEYINKFYIISMQCPKCQNYEKYLNKNLTVEEMFAQYKEDISVPLSLYRFRTVLKDSGRYWKNSNKNVCLKCKKSEKCNLADQARNESQCIADKRVRRSPPNKCPTDKMKELEEHVKNIPFVFKQCNQCQQMKKYVNSGVTVTALYRSYEEQTSNPLSLKMFRMIFKDSGLHLMNPLVEKCKECLDSSNSVKAIDHIDKRGKHTPPNKSPLEKIQEIENHIKTYTVFVSQCQQCRNYEKHLLPDLTVAKMYKKYEETAANPLSIGVYRKIFKESGLNLKSSKSSDLCTQCQEAASKIKCSIDRIIKASTWPIQN
ncbi:uncharacterized protein LOC106651423 isoform X2 [Trichogramma pretiosum]|uniref:uncharacterized protein LOC106651423 isoform X2 n=1 Tax=Trichogramma pretiosum TaxID=7493 RepID=UPI0006C963CB|nr:uncharacterized protein LOC106651423 isoform X2 [Trichogramma pretiosum]